MSARWTAADYRRDANALADELAADWREEARAAADDWEPNDRPDAADLRWIEDERRRDERNHKETS